MVYPGAYVWCALRHAMQLGTRDLPPGDVAPEARHIAQVLADASPRLAPRWGPVVAKWSKDLSAYADRTLLHDQLEAVYYPVYFTEFVDQAAASGLRYLSDATRDDIKNVAGGAREQIEKLTGDPILRAQYVDIAGFRMFRQSILCRKDAALTPADPLGVVERAHLSSDKFLPGASSAKQTVPKLELNSLSPLGQAVYRELSARWPRTISFPELRSRVSTTSAQAGDRTLATFIHQLHTAGQVELWMDEPTFIDNGSDSKRASVTKLARVQAAKGIPVTNLRHEAFSGADDVARRMVASLDGSEPSADVLKHIPTLARHSMLVNQNIRE
jgi:methyltransferase-like protein